MGRAALKLRPPPPSSPSLPPLSGIWSKGEKDLYGFAASVRIVGFKGRQRQSRKESQQASRAPRRLSSSMLMVNVLLLTHTHAHTYREYKYKYIYIYIYIHVHTRAHTHTLGMLVSFFFNS